MFIYFLSGIGGNLLSSIFTVICTIGASTSIFGLFGCIIGYLIINWSALTYRGNKPGAVLLIIIVIVAINIFMGFVSKNVDNYGHIGGLLTGFFLGILLLDPLIDGKGPEIENHRVNHIIKRIVSLIVLITLFIVGFVLFYTIRQF
jgi:membrane associated rhomboid family serine protease